MMQQSEILKSLLSEYLTGGGDVNDLEAATAYINQHKPPGVGQAKPVITRAIFRVMGQNPVPRKPALAPVESLRIVIASKTVTFPAKMRDKPQAVYYEAPPAPPAPAPAPSPAITKVEQPEPAKTPPAPSATRMKRLLSKLKFWK
jgi:hypothetical protein